MENRIKYRTWRIRSWSILICINFTRLDRSLQRSTQVKVFSLSCDSFPHFEIWFIFFYTHRRNVWKLSNQFPIRSRHLCTQRSLAVIPTLNIHIHPCSYLLLLLLFLWMRLLLWIVLMFICTCSYVWLKGEQLADLYFLQVWYE